MVFEYCYRIFFCASPDVRMCNQMGFKQIMCVFLPLSFVSYVWFLSRKILNRRAHSYFGNTTVYSFPVCAKSFKTLAGLKRHEQSGIHEFEKKARKNKAIPDFCIQVKTWVWIEIPPFLVVSVRNGVFWSGEI